MEQLFTKRSVLFLNLVQLYPHPDEVLAHAKTVICTRLKANPKKWLSLKRVEEKGISLLKTVQNLLPSNLKKKHTFASRIEDLQEKKGQLVKRNG
ncbi:hypothetical protein ACQKIW_30300 [Bacillus thuringiensis]|uniref:hypothetical protein n=1 Tax=Bacillus thuringiensis TaxID=1428 RepID=UPI003D078376